MKNLTIAIDFDDTLTAAPKMWREFIDSARSHGHRVICVTARRETEDNIDTVDEWLAEHGIELAVYYTGLASKLGYVAKLGIKVDIWIEDDMRTAVHGH